MIIAYPIALYTLALVAYVIYAIGGIPFWFQVGTVAGVGGALMAIVAAVPGFLDWALGVPSTSPAKAHGLRHMLLNVTALVLFIINDIVNVPQWLSPTPDKLWGVVFAFFGVVCTVAAGFFGWIMIQDDHVGVALSPEQARLERPLAPRAPGESEPWRQPGGRLGTPTPASKSTAVIIGRHRAPPTGWPQGRHAAASRPQ
jgi:uncharacterized membrane protein